MPPVFFHQSMSKQTPYWNFWRAVFAGWMIRYPKQIFKMVGVIILIPVLSILSMCSTVDEVNAPWYTEDTERPQP